MLDDKNYKFIKEKIAPKKKSRIGRIILVCFLIVFSAVIFGITERIVFEFSGEILPYFGLVKKENTKVELNKDIDKNEVSSKPAIQDNFANSKILEKKTVKIVEKRVSADISDYKSIFNKFGEVATKLNDSVVEIQSVVKNTDWFDNYYEITKSFVGYIVAKEDKKAFILTSYKEINNSNKLKIIFKNGVILDGAVKNFNKELNIALLKVNLKELEDSEFITPIKFINYDYHNIGEPVMAIGKPNGYIYSVIPGVITGVGDTKNFYDYCLQAFYTDISVESGEFSLIVNFDGYVVGLLDVSQDGVNKVVSISKIMYFIENIINNKSIPYLGIKFKKFIADEEKIGFSGGILVEKVANDSPAAMVGIRAGDIIYKLDDKEIETVEDYEKFIENRDIGDTVVITLYRFNRNKGKEVKFKLEIGDSRGIE